MKSTEIWAYLRALSNKELKQLRLWLHSPAFNQRPEVIALFDFLKKNLTKTKNRDFSRKAAWDEIFPDKVFDGKKLHYTVHYLLQITQKFLTFLEMEQDTSQQQLLLCQALKRRQMNHHFEIEMRSLDRIHERHPFKNTKLHFTRFQFYVEQHEHIIRNSRSAKLPLQPLLKNLENFFMATLLRYACSALTLSTVTNQHFGLPLLSEVLDYLKSSPPDPDNSPAVVAYYRGYRLLEGNSSDLDFQELKNFLTDHWQKFPLAEMHDIWLMAINYGIRQLNSGEKKYVRETFELFKDGLEKGILPGENNMTKFTYKNIVRLGLGLNEISWIENFLHTGKQFLEPRHRENHFHYNLAFYHYHQKNYDKAMQLLNEVEVDDVFLQLDAKAMLIRIYFEKQYYDALDSLLESFQVFVKRQSNLGYQRKNYLNLIRLTKKILQIPAGEKEARKKLAIEIAKTKSVAERSWLLEKLDPNN